MACVIGGSMIGAASNKIPAQTSWIKNTWGYALAFLYTLVPALVEAAVTKDYCAKAFNRVTCKTICLLLIAPFLHLTWYWGLYFGAENIV